jgi:DedD protein
MEQQLKERLVGAAVLVTLAVILIPLLLDGPDSGESARTEPALSSADNGAGRIVVEIKRNADAPAGPPNQTRPGPPKQSRPGPPSAEATPSTTSGPAAAVSAPARRVEAAGPAQTAPAVTAEPAPAKPSRPAGSGTQPAAQSSPAKGAPTVADGWAVQVGSFGSRDNAEKLRGQLSADGFPVFLMRVESGGRTFHRVRVGPYADRADAEAAAGRLAAAGPGGTVVRQGG